MSHSIMPNGTLLKQNNNKLKNTIINTDNTKAKQNHRAYITTPALNNLTSLLISELALGKTRRFRQTL